MFFFLNLLTYKIDEKVKFQKKMKKIFHFYSYNKLHHNKNLTNKSFSYRSKSFSAF